MFALCSPLCIQCMYRTLLKLFKLYISTSTWIRINTYIYTHTHLHTNMGSCTFKIRTDRTHILAHQSTCFHSLPLFSAVLFPSFDRIVDSLLLLLFVPDQHCALSISLLPLSRIHSRSTYPILCNNNNNNSHLFFHCYYYYYYYFRQPKIKRQENCAYKHIEDTCRRTIWTVYAFVRYIRCMPYVNCVHWCACFQHREK